MNDELVAEIRSDFPYIHDKVYLDNATVTPIPKRVQRAGDFYNTIMSEDLRGYRAASLPLFDKGRLLVAHPIGTTYDRISYVQNTSHGLSLVPMGPD